MARLYADEDFPLPAVEELRRLGHDVRTVQEAGRAGQGIDDAEVLAEATADQRAVLFKRLHQQGQPHEGIITCTQDPLNHSDLAQRLEAARTYLGLFGGEVFAIATTGKSVVAVGAVCNCLS